jgi:hypothetical protein
MTPNPFSQMIIKIISEQESIIGPLAVEQAQKVNGLKLDWPHKQISVNGDEKAVIDSLINQYEKIFGRASVEICKEVASSFINQLTKNEIPSILQ